MKKICALCAFLCVSSCVAEPPAAFEVTRAPIAEDPYPYDDFVYGDSYLDEDKDGESTEFDCNDENPFVWTGASELCNKIDDNCNGKTDEAEQCL